jgi:hypothetical protein
VGHNLLITGQGGWLHLDEPLREPPVSATVSLRLVEEKRASNGAFMPLFNEPCVLDDVRFVLPERLSPWRSVEPVSTSGLVGDLTDPRRRLLFLRGGRRLYLTPNEFDVDGNGDVVLLRFDEGIDVSARAGDTLSGIRCSYYVDLDGIDFVGRVQADWQVTLGSGETKRFTHVYDCMRQEIGQPATWRDVLAIRPDADNEMSQVKDKESLVRRAWEQVVERLQSLGIWHNLVIPDGSTSLRDAVVAQTILNMVMHQNLTVPEAFAGQGDYYIQHLERGIQAPLSSFSMPIDGDQDGEIRPGEVDRAARQVWFRGNRRW